jgi:hypothetical protein
MGPAQNRTLGYWRFWTLGYCTIIIGSSGIRGALTALQKRKIVSHCIVCWFLLKLRHFPDFLSLFQASNEPANSTESIVLKKMMASELFR